MARKASSKPADSTANLGDGADRHSFGIRHSAFVICSVHRLAIRGIEADIGKEHADSFRAVQHPNLRADYVLATAKRDSAFLNAKPYSRACRRQDNPMPFNDSDTALCDSAFLQREAKMQVVSEAKDNFRKDDDVRWQSSGARQIAKGNPQGERGGVHQFGVLPKGNANFAWVQHFIHHLAPQGMAGFVLANGSMSSNQSGEGYIHTPLSPAADIRQAT